MTFVNGLAQLAQAAGIGKKADAVQKASALGLAPFLLTEVVGGYI